MRKLNSLLSMFMAAVLVLSSCGEDPAPDNPVTITGIPPTATIPAGGSIGPVTATITAADGLASFEIKKDGAVLATVPLNGETSATQDFNYTATPADAGKNLVFEFTARDRNGSVASVLHVLTVEAEATVIRVTENISGKVTWEASKTYILGGRISVLNGAELTIEAGTVIKGEVGSGPNATALLIARGGKLFANGTADKPIIFTSIADEIVSGQIASPNLEPNISGLWGGLLVLGRAPGSFAGDVTEIQIEGIPPSDTNGLYGGNDPADNSGVIKYISIRHGGANIGEGNEINGLTLGGVGSGTVIENVEVIGNADDGIEWFGGTVDVKNAIIWNAGDDAVDTDQSWAGTLDNFIVLCGSETDHALEIDGPEGSLLAGHNVKNGTVRGNAASELGDFRSGARGRFENIYFFGFPNPATSNGRGDFSLSGEVDQNGNPIGNKSLDNFLSGVLAFDKLEVTSPAGVPLTTVFRNGTHVHASEVALHANTVGATKAAFTGWSWSAVAGNLDDLK